MTLKNAIYRALFAIRHPDAIRIWRRGIDYDQYRSINRPWLKRLNIRTVIDVGANVGQFARLIHAVIPDATIFSFEPLVECHKILSRALVGWDRFHAINCALGESAGEMEFWKSPHTPSSSFLRMTSVHEAVYPESRFSRSVKVKVRMLDDISKEIGFQDNIIVKIDVQGYEWSVIKGGQETIRRAAVVLIETSFISLYRNQMLFADLLERMRTLGFSFYGNTAQYDDPRSECHLFADSIFINDGFVDQVIG